MIEEILPGFYQLQVPFPNNPLRNINCYIIKAGDRALMVDTGVNLEDCRNAVLTGLKALNADLNKTDFFITHLHTDHIGLLARLVSENSTAYFNHPDAASLSYDITQAWERRANAGIRNGFPGKELLATGNHPMYQFREWTNHTFHLLKQGDVIDFGDSHFLCIETPGHTRGHMCLYEPARRLLLSGDHILGDITPNISSWSADDNPLADYLASLDKVSELDVALVLPGHRRTFTNMKGRINELKRHHEVRANEALSILEKGRQNAYQVASQMTWDLTYDSWDAVPVWQRMFATGEAAAHLKYLESQGKVYRQMGEGEILYSLKNDQP